MSEKLFLALVQKWLDQRTKMPENVRRNCESSDFLEKWQKFQSLFILETVISMSFSFQYYYNMEIFRHLHTHFLTSSRRFNFLAFFHPRNKKTGILNKFWHFYALVNLRTFFTPVHFSMRPLLWSDLDRSEFPDDRRMGSFLTILKQKNIELNDGIAQYGICSTTRETIQEFRIGAKMGCSKT